MITLYTKVCVPNCRGTKTERYPVRTDVKALHHDIYRHSFLTSTRDDSIKRLEERCEHLEAQVSLPVML